IEENTQNPNREPTYLQLRQRVRKIEQTVEERRKELRPEVEKKWRQTVKVELDSKINGLQADVDALTVQEGKLKTEADNLRKEIQKIVTGTREDENLRAEIDNQRAFVRDLDKQLQTARYDLAVRPRVTVPSEAALMARDIKKQLFGGALGAIAGLFG